MNTPQQFTRRLGLVAAGLACLAWLSAAPAQATPLAQSFDQEGMGLAVTSGGVGLRELGAGTAMVSVDIGGPVVAAYLYWAGREPHPCVEDAMNNCVVTGLDQDLIFDGTPITGMEVGNEIRFASGGQQKNLAYRADVTAQVAAAGTGMQSFTIEDGDLASNLLRLNGASLLVIYTDPAEIDDYRVIVYEGLDFAFVNTNPSAAKVTDPVTFNYAATDEDRTGELIIAVGDAEDSRPDRVDISDNMSLVNTLDADDGVSWDHDLNSISIPMGISATTVEVVSPAEFSNSDSELWTLGVLRLPVTVNQCWMTAGGVKFERILDTDVAEHGPKDSLGGNVFPGCSPTAGQGGQWNHVAHTEKLHFQGFSVDAVTCGNVPGIEPGSESPVTPFNWIEFSGEGRLKGIKGDKTDLEPVYFFGRVEDRNEPGNEHASAGEDIDKYFLQVFTDPSDPNGSTVLLIDEDGMPATVDPVTITGGNLQLHISSCDTPPSGF